MPLDEIAATTRWLAIKLLIQPRIPDERVFAVPTDLPTKTLAAEAYAQTLRSFFSVSGDQPPVFDLILLGLGDDGHTASLFPQQHTLVVMDTPVTFSPPGVLPPPVDRVTLTYPAALNAAQPGIVSCRWSKQGGTAVRDVLQNGADRNQRLSAAGSSSRDGKTPSAWLTRPPRAA